MPGIILFVEDELNEAYEILVRKTLGLPLIGATGHCIRVVRVTLNELTQFEELKDLAKRAQRSGCEQVVFCLDHEGHEADEGRVRARDQFRAAFQQLCSYINDLPDEHLLKRIRLVRVDVHTCLESWLLSDPQAIARAAGDSSYAPKYRRTDLLTPRQARDEIAHILQEVGKRRSKRHLRRISGEAVKSWGKRIARAVNITQARQYNFSLNYFCDMIETQGNGCEQPFPDPP